MKTQLAQLSLVVVCLLCTVSHFTAAATILNRPQRNDISTVADALKYLQELDHYYSQISRPRFGKRNDPLNLRDQPEDIKYAMEPSEEVDWKAKLFTKR